jgi:hypothetical protein
LDRIEEDEAPRAQSGAEESVWMGEKRPARASLSSDRDPDFGLDDGNDEAGAASFEEDDPTAEALAGMDESEGAEDAQAKRAERRANGGSESHAWAELFERWPSPLPQTESLPPAWRAWLRRPESAPGRAAFAEAWGGLTPEGRRKLGRLGPALGSAWLWGGEAGLLAAPERALAPKSPAGSPLRALALLVAMAAAVGQLPSWAGFGALAGLAAISGPALAQALFGKKPWAAKGPAATGDAGPLAAALGRWGDEGARALLVRETPPSASEAARWAPDGWGASSEPTGQWIGDGRQDAEGAMAREAADEAALRAWAWARGQGASAEAAEEIWALEGAERQKEAERLAWAGLSRAEALGWLAFALFGAAGFAALCLLGSDPHAAHWAKWAAAAVGALGTLGACGATEPARQRIDARKNAPGAKRG